MTEETSDEGLSIKVQLVHGSYYHLRYSLCHETVRRNKLHVFSKMMEGGSVNAPGAVNQEISQVIRGVPFCLFPEGGLQILKLLLNP